VWRTALFAVWGDEEGSIPTARYFATHPSAAGSSAQAKCSFTGHLAPRCMSGIRLMGRGSRLTARHISVEWPQPPSPHLTARGTSPPAATCAWREEGLVP